MSLSKPNTVDRYIFAIALPFSNLPINYSRWLTCANIIIYRLVLCALPCILYISQFKTIMKKDMLVYVQIGAFFCFSYIALLTYVCYRSDYIQKHFPPMFWIFVVLTLLFFIMAILLATHNTYNLTKSDVDDVLEAFQGVVGITKELSNDDYTKNATTIEDIENNLKILQNDLQNKDSVSEDISPEMDQIDDLIDSVKKNLQEQIDALNKELENDPDQEERENISEKVDSLKETMGNLETYYNKLQPYRNNNKGNIFIFIMCVLFVLISTVAFVCDASTTYNYSN